MKKTCKYLELLIEAYETLNLASKFEEKFMDVNFVVFNTAKGPVSWQSVISRLVTASGQKCGQL